MQLVLVQRGEGPIILGFPHVGTFVPDAVRARLNAEGLLLRDTDWHIEQLYAGLLPGASVVQATFHRYVIDANRDPSGNSLYPGAFTTGLVPETDFDGVPIWREGQGPTADDLAQRLRDFHAPYHAALAAEIARVREKHGVAVLFDCHSIRSHIPALFDGELPVFNIGTDGGRTCDARLAVAVERCAAASGESWVMNGRFRGGWTTRHYGQPQGGVHAIQLELAQRSHLSAEQPPFMLDDAKAQKLRITLQAMLEYLQALAPTLSPAGDTAS